MTDSGHFYALIYIYNVSVSYKYFELRAPEYIQLVGLYENIIAKHIETK